MKKLLIAILLFLLQNEISLAQSSCNNRWTGPSPKVTFTLQNDTIYDFALIWDDTIISSDTIVVSGGKLYKGALGYTIQDIRGEFSANRKSFSGIITYCNWIKVSESPDRWDCFYKTQNWTAFPDSVIPHQPSIITGPTSVCSSLSGGTVVTGGIHYSVVNTNSSFTWSATGGTVWTEPNSLSGMAANGTGVKWSIPGTQVITVTPYNGCGQGLSRSLEVEVNPTPEITGISEGSHCQPGNITLSATATGGTINWYSSWNNVGSGSTFTTAIIPRTMVFSVKAISDSNCVSQSVQVKASIYGVIFSTTSNFRCGPGGVLLSADSDDAGEIRWFNDSLGGDPVFKGETFYPNLTSTKTFYVESAYKDCVSSYRKPVIAKISNLPEINTRNGSNCGPGEVVLEAYAIPEPITYIRWYTDSLKGTYLGEGSVFRTPSIESTKLYYVRAQNKCGVSIASVKATIAEVPEITSVTNGSRCGIGTVQLEASASSDNISWYADSTGGDPLGLGTSFTTPILTSSTDYFVDANYNNCTTKKRTNVTATVDYSVDCAGIVSYPNPTSGIFEVAINIPLEEDFKIELFKIDGHLMWSALKPKDEHLIKADLSNYASGIYFIKVTSANKYYQSRIVLQKNK